MLDASAESDRSDLDRRPRTVRNAANSAELWSHGIPARSDNSSAELCDAGGAWIRSECTGSHVCPPSAELRLYCSADGCQTRNTFVQNVNLLGPL